MDMKNDNEQSLSELIKIDRPNITESSVKTYVQNLKKLGIIKVEDLEKLYDTTEMMKTIDDNKLSMKRNLISSIIVIIRAAAMRKELYEVYRQQLFEYTRQYNMEISQNEKTAVQEKNWVKMSELKKIARNLAKKKINQDALIAYLYSYTSPCRLDYYSMKIVGPKDILDKNQNYLVIHNTRRKEFVFRDFKTSNKYNEIIIKVNKDINRIINQFLKLHPERKYLLQKKDGEPLSRNALGKLLPRIFKDTGKEVSINIIRHVYITENTDLEMLKSAKELSHDMMHGTGVQMTYAKN